LSCMGDVPIKSINKLPLAHYKYLVE